VEEDVARLGYRNWKIVALNREGRKKHLKEAEAVGKREKIMNYDSHHY
jgi:hypothetical protein